jgi:methionyl aminopeptidase
MIIIKTPLEINKIKKASKITMATLNLLRENIIPGVKTIELDKMAESYIKENGGTPVFKGHEGYPYSTCISVNDEVIHGLPSSRMLKAGDLVSVDTGVQFDGYCGDSAFTTCIGLPSIGAMSLIALAEQSFLEALQFARSGIKVGVLSSAIQMFVEKAGYNVVRGYGGHGIGRELHEEPWIPNAGKFSDGPVLKAGMVICIEPMVLEGDRRTFIDGNGWTVRTRDGKLASHYEHTVLITDGDPEILSTCCSE